MAHMERLYGRTSARPYITAAAALSKDSSEARTLQATAGPPPQVDIGSILPLMNVSKGSHNPGILAGKLIIRQWV